MRQSHGALRTILRLIGSSSLFAVIFVLAPSSWISSIHTQIGMGEFPDVPVAWYLARSTSALYALLGGLFWVVSFDLVRHRRVLQYLGAAIIPFGLTLLVVDWQEALPVFWKVWEGPFMIVFGVALFALSRRIPQAGEAAKRGAGG